MNEVGKQLIENQKRRATCLADAAIALRNLLVATGYVGSDEEKLASIDFEEVDAQVGRLKGFKAQMRALRDERAALKAQA